MAPRREVEAAPPDTSSPTPGGYLPTRTGYPLQRKTLRLQKLGCCEVLKVGGPFGPVTDNFGWLGSNSGGPKQKNRK